MSRIQSLLSVAKVSAGTCGPGQHLVKHVGRRWPLSDVLIDTSALPCQSGRWQRLTSRFEFGGNFFTRYDSSACLAPNFFTGSCSCPSGFLSTYRWASQLGEPAGTGISQYDCLRVN